MKACPFCAEQIQDDAIKCRFCGEWLDGRGAGGSSGAFDVLLEGAGERTLTVIKLIRSVGRHRLREAHDLVTRPPSVVARMLSRDVAEELVRQLEATGARASIGPSGSWEDAGSTGAAPNAEEVSCPACGSTDLDRRLFGGYRCKICGTKF